MQIELICWHCGTKKIIEGEECNMFRDEYITFQTVNNIFKTYEEQGGVKE
jgi:hypothetical protein